MIAADRPDRRYAKLFVVDADGGMQHVPRAELASLLRASDLVVANDAATLPGELARHALRKRRGDRGPARRMGRCP
jgi:S-adenosylmethionine:tRNA ribosyltransferase-isomerase